MLPKAHLTSHSRISGSRWVTIPSWLSGSLRSMLCSSVYSCHLFSISSVYVRSLPFLSFIVFILAWNFPFISPVLLERSLVLPILLFSSISLHCSFQKAVLPLLAILWNSAFSWVYLSFLHCLLLFFAQLCVKPPYTTTLPSCISFFFEMVLATSSYTMLRTSVHSSSGTLSTKSNPLTLFGTSTILS